MESRKVQRVGSSTLAVSLPKEWVKKAGLRKGDVIFFDQEENDILKLITVKQRADEKSGRMSEINADLCRDPKMLCRVLAGSYVLGHDMIKVVSSTRLKTEQINAIRNIMHELMGIGIIEETHNQIMIQCLIDVTKFPVHTLLRRLYIIASTMHKEVVDALLEFDINLAEEAIHRKNEAETMFWIIVRLLNSCQRDKVMTKKLNIEGSMQVLWYRLVAQYLRLIADWSEKAARKVVALGKNRERIGEHLLNEMLRINESSHGVCHKAINSLFSSDVNLANQAMETYDEIQKTEEQLQETICSHAYLHGKAFSVSKYFKGKKPIEPCMIAQISFMIWGARRIAELGYEIAEIAIHKALCKHTRLCKEQPITD